MVQQTRAPRGDAPKEDLLRPGDGAPGGAQRGRGAGDIVAVGEDRLAQRGPPGVEDLRRGPGAVLEVCSVGGAGCDVGRD